jgi:hypothetical protein
MTLIRRVAGHPNWAADDGPQDWGYAGDYVWTLEMWDIHSSPLCAAEDPLNADSVEPWGRDRVLAWLLEEIRYEEHPGYYGRMARWWLAAPEEAPLNILVRPDGLGMLLAGHHRYAIAVRAGLREVPVYAAWAKP